MCVCTCACMQSHMCVCIQPGRSSGGLLTNMLVVSVINMHDVIMDRLQCSLDRPL
jgi:hypothetical protein